MTLEDAVRLRRSVRGFLPDEVLPETMDKIFALAQHAPSGCNAQPWLPHVVSGEVLRQLRERLLAAGHSQPPEPDWPVRNKYSGVYRDRQYDAAARLYGAMGIERHDVEGRKRAALRNLEFFDAPHVAFVFMDGTFDIREAIDAGMYAQTLMLAMTSFGIASCAQGALSLYPSIVRDHLGVQGSIRLLFGISFGYEDKDVPANDTRVGRCDVASAVQFHQ